MKGSFVIVILHHLILIAAFIIAASANAGVCGNCTDGRRLARSIDSILDTLVSLESTSPRSLSRSESTRTNSYQNNAASPYSGIPHDPTNQKQSSLFRTNNKNSKGSSTIFSSQNKRPSERRMAEMSQGQRRLDHNFPMIPFPPPFDAFPGYGDRRDVKQLSFPHSDRSSEGSKSGKGNNEKYRDDEFYGNEYPNTKYSMMPNRDQNPGQKDHEILKASGYSSSKVFFPSHGMPPPQEISIPMFSQGHERGSSGSLTSRDGHEQHSKQTATNGGFDDIRDLEKALGLRRQPHGNELVPQGNHLGHRYAERKPADIDFKAYRYAEGQLAIRDLPGRVPGYGGSQARHRDLSGDKNSGSEGIHEDHGHHDEDQFTDRGHISPLRGNTGRSQPGHGRDEEGQFNNAAHGSLGLGPFTYEGTGIGHPFAGGHSGYGYLSSMYPATNHVWRGYGQGNFGYDDKTHSTAVNAAALQALEGITSLDHHASHSYSGIELPTSYNQYTDLSGYASLFK